MHALKRVLLRSRPNFKIHHLRTRTTSTGSAAAVAAAAAAGAVVGLAFIFGTTATTATATTTPGAVPASNQQPPFTLPPLPYPKTGLEPYISSETVELHYEKHHRGYVNKLNELTKGTPLAEKTIQQIILTETGKPFNLAGQVWNHTFYWDSLTANKEHNKKPTGKLLHAIEESFGSFENFHQQFTNVALNHFGSGWAWLVREKNSNKLSIVDTHDAGNPLTQNLEPLLTCDVWEHAYYVDRRNDRAAYIAAWWQVVDWNAVEKRLT